MIRVSINSIKEGMKIAKPIFDFNGKLLVGRDAVINKFLIDKLRNMNFVNLWIQVDNTDDILPHENISEIVRGSIIHHMKELFRSIEQINNDLKNQSEKSIIDTITSDQFIDSSKNIPAIEKIIDDVYRIVYDLTSGETMIGLRSIRTQDNYKLQHMIDVAIFSIIIGLKIGLPGKKLRELGIGCLLHDIGEIFIYDDIFNKPDKLTSEEFAKVKSHTIIGYELIRNMSNVDILSAHVTFQHHEKQDGTGYPRGLRGSNKIGITNDPRFIHLYGSIAAIAEVYDSLSSDRPYRKAFPPEKVIALMHEMCDKYLNREIFNKFLIIAPLYPEGTNIRVISRDELNNFSGVVSDINSNKSDRPTIRLIFNNNNDIIDPIVINLINIDKEDIKIEPVI